MKKSVGEYEKYRIKAGYWGSDKSYGITGAFIIPFRSYKLTIMASDGMGWEHVSVSLPNRCPNWQEMCFVKDIFWKDDEIVIQYHRPKKEYINSCPNCLHMWRPINKKLFMPPKVLVGI